LLLYFVDIKKEKGETRTSDFLSTPLPKRQKSPIGSIIQRGGRLEDTHIKREDDEEESEDDEDEEEELTVKQEALDANYFHDTNEFASLPSSLPVVSDIGLYTFGRAKNVDSGEGLSNIEGNVEGNNIIARAKEAVQAQGKAIAKSKKNTGRKGSQRGSKRGGKRGGK
jgi:hypothetical protein